MMACQKYANKVWMIGASLSEPHTSVTALRKCVRMLGSVCVSLSRENEREGLLPDCKFGEKESESEDDLS